MVTQCGNNSNSVSGSSGPFFEFDPRMRRVQTTSKTSGTFTQQVDQGTDSGGEYRRGQLLESFDAVKSKVAPVQTHQDRAVAAQRGNLEAAFSGRLANSGVRRGAPGQGSAHGSVVPVVDIDLGGEEEEDDSCAVVAGGAVMWSGSGKPPVGPPLGKVPGPPAPVVKTPPPAVKPAEPLPSGRKPRRSAKTPGAPEPPSATSAAAPGGVGPRGALGAAPPPCGSQASSC